MSKLIEYETLRELALEVISSSGKNLQYNKIRRGIESLIDERQLGLYDHQTILSINQIVWDLIIERIITPGYENGSEPCWPFLRLTEFGKQIVHNNYSGNYDPLKYIEKIENIVGDLDEVIKQYLYEAFRSYKHSLFFSAAVIIGAAAERALLILLDSIKKWEDDATKQNKITNLIDRPNLPKIFELISKTVNTLIEAKQIPYAIHEGSTEHLLSFYEMIRVQRNESVHPKVVKVNNTKVLLSIQTFPEGLKVLNRISSWFLDNAKSELL